MWPNSKTYLKEKSPGHNAVLLDTAKRFFMNTNDTSAESKNYMEQKNLHIFFMLVFFCSHKCKAQFKPRELCFTLCVNAYRTFIVLNATE